MLCILLILRLLLALFLEVVVSCTRVLVILVTLGSIRLV